MVGIKNNPRQVRFEELDKIKDAQKCWLEVALEKGIEIPEPAGVDEYSGKFNIRMPKSLHRTLVDYQL